MHQILRQKSAESVGMMSELTRSKVDLLSFGGRNRRWVFVRNVSTQSVCLTYGSGVPEGTLHLWTVPIKWHPILLRPPYDGRQDPPSPAEVTNRPSSHSRQCDDFILRLRCIIQSLSGSRWQDETGGPFSPDLSLSFSPETETLHLRSAWWAFKSLKWVFGSVAPQEAAHLSPKRLFF